jgi:hypothetical protein
MAKKNNPGCRCCGCDYAKDEFTRANTSTLGSTWNERSGSWNIASNKATTSSTNALAIHNTPADPSLPMVVEATVKGATTNDLLRLIIGYLDDNNYLFAEAKINTGTSALRLWKRSGGVNMALAAASGSTTTQALNAWTFRLCYRNGMFSMGGDITGQTVSAIAPGSYGGIATGGTVGSLITFDDFRISGGKSENALRCPVCGGGCSCCTDGGPGLFKIVVAGIGANSSGFPPGNLNGTWFARSTGSNCDHATDLVTTSTNCGGFGTYAADILTNIACDLTTVTVTATIRYFCIGFPGISNFVTYSTTMSRPQACLDFNGLVLPFASSPGGTTGYTGSTCTLTAL